MRKHGGPTINDIALHAGTNRTSVSVVLNGGRSSAGVSAATRQRIVLAAKELGYTPNAVARSLSQRRTNTISFFTGSYSFNTDVPFVAMIFLGLQRGCAEFHKDLLLHGMFLQGNPGSTTVTYGELANGKIDGVVLLTNPEDHLGKQVKESFLSAVAIVDGIPGIPSVVADDADGSRLIARHLHERGHRRVIYRASPDWLPSSKLRWTTICEEAAALGMTVETYYPRLHEEPLSDEERRLLTLPGGRRFTAIVCFADLAAYSVLDDCERQGLRVPEDVAIVGYDGIRMLFQGGPRRDLTTVRAPWERVSYMAVKLLNMQFEGQEAPPLTVLPVELYVGDTT
jgi:DNA-binding LacI/PurR family transcriptional regulator